MTAMLASAADRSDLAVHEPYPVALVCMPFFMAIRPSIQIGLLQAIAERAGFPTDAYHLNLELAARLDPGMYSAFSRNHHHQICEWLCSLAAFGQETNTDDEAYFRTFPEIVGWIHHLGKDTAYLSFLRHELLPRYIEDCLDMVDWGSYRMVGFTSTFQQDVASLALARRIKARHPSVVTVLGGANLEGEMGLEHLRAFPFIDYMVMGEADIAFPALLGRLAAGETPDDVPGVAGRTAEGVTFHSLSPLFEELDSLPTPDYEEYFERSRRLALHNRGEATWAIPFESSRGCWWGDKHQCTFCGLNGLRLCYRAKSPERMMAELAELADRHGITFFEALDNIVDMRYLKEFFPALQAGRLDYEFFYATKANLTREQLRTLRRGGVRWLQPGIESLNTHVLQLMHKGCTMLQNVRLLKWCRYYRINVAWNLLMGFPGEREEDYREQLALLRLITHLEPPANCSPFWLERFSPYFADPVSSGLHDVRPQASYGYVYPEYVALERLAYFFEHTVEDGLSQAIYEETHESVTEWQQRWNSAQPDFLYYRRTPGSLFVDQRRGTGMQRTHAFHGPMAVIYEHCSDTMHTVPQVVAHLSASPQGYDYAAGEVQAALEMFCQRDLMLAEDGKYLSLAVPANPNW